MIRSLSHEMNEFPDRSSTSLQHPGRTRRAGWNRLKTVCPLPWSCFLLSLRSQSDVQRMRRSFSSSLPSWSRSVWGPAFILRHMHLTCCTVNTPFLHYLTVFLHQMWYFLCTAQQHFSNFRALLWYPFCSTRVPFYLVGDVVAY